MKGRVELRVGSVILTNRGRLVIMSLQPNGFEVSSGGGQLDYVFLPDLLESRPQDAGFDGLHRSLFPWWEQLSSEAREEALARLDAVMEICTGYKSGNAEMAAEGEPFVPFGPDDGASEFERCKAMARRWEALRRPVTSQTLYNWIRAWEAHGLRGLVDGRKTRVVQDWGGLDERVREIAGEIYREFDGSRSAVAMSEIRRRILVKAREEEIPQSGIPDRTLRDYVRWLKQQRGSTPRAHRSAKVRRRSGFSSSALLHPSHVSMDVTRADNLVWDEDMTRPISVEIITVHSVATRVVLACRVVPRSATSVDAALAMYDAMRPFSMRVEGTYVDDFRWAGLPQSLSVKVPERYSNPDPGLQGSHWLPSVRPSSLRTDHGANFMSRHFMGVLDEFKIDFLPSRVGASTDNSFTERWHETVQQVWQQAPGFKGRNPSGRGRFVAAEDLLTVAGFERLLHRYIALHYHRAWHEGLVVPGKPDARMTPLEYFDALLAATGSIDVPQHPDLLYQFLPVVWLTPNGAGVEYKNLSFDGPALQEFRRVRKGQFRRDSHQMPFHYDPRDVSRLWFRHPDTDRIHEVAWRGAAQLNAPMTDRVLGRALSLIQQRGGNSALKRETATRRIIEVLGELAQAPGPDLVADKLRWSAAQRDHAEAADAAAGSGHGISTDVTVDLDEPWPDYGKRAG